MDTATDSKSLAKKPAGLRYFDDVLLESLKMQFLAFILAIPDSAWQTLGKRGRFTPTRRRRIGYGRVGKDDPIPDELKGLLKAILDHIMPLMSVEEQRLLCVFLVNDYRFTINRYTKNMDLGAHLDDPAGPDAIVIGFTMGTKTTTTRHMIWKKQGSNEVHTQITHDNSVYVFYGDAYTDWTHGSGKPSDGDVYSITIRANC
jgi:hypothetical protein